MPQEQVAIKHPKLDVVKVVPASTARVLKKHGWKDAPKSDQPAQTEAK